MQPKNLGWKFAFVALLVALALYSVWAKELRWGLDLKGGHILTFEVQLEPGEGRDVVKKVIDVLKKRVDPEGTASLEWRPVGENRFEVRMPMGTEASREAKEAFEAAIERIEDGNIKRSQLARLERGAMTVEELSDGDPDREAALRKLLAAYRAMQAAEKKLTELKGTTAVPHEDLAKAQAELDDAMAARNDATQAVLETNIPTGRLRASLSLYITRAEAKLIPLRRRQARTGNFDRQMKAIRHRYSEAVSEIDVILGAMAKPAGQDAKTSPEDARRLDELRAKYAAKMGVPADRLDRERLTAMRAGYARGLGQIDEAEKTYKTWAERRRGRLDDPADLKRLVARAGVLEFRIAPMLPAADKDRAKGPDHHRYIAQLTGEGPLAGRSANEPYQWFPLREGAERLNPNLIVDRYAGRRYVLLDNRGGFTMLQRAGSPPWSLSARFGTDELGRPAVLFSLDARGGRLMGNLTRVSKNEFMAILLDDEVYSAPVIKATIYADGVIEGSFTRTEVEEMIRTLNAGALRARVNPDPVSEKTIAPSMGEENREAGIRAARYGLIFVAAFMLIYYLYAGGIADVALMLNLILVLGAMSFIEAVLTLPGIAGLILTIGIAVDANVLIFERLREEQAKTQSMRMAIRNAYSNAASAILDGNATTLITCLILGWVGTEEIRGFAITLGLGVMFSLFTSLVVTRWVFQLLVEIGAIKDRIRMVAFIGTPNIDWMKKRRIFWAVSVILVAAGIAAISTQGRDVLGLEFSSGTQAVFTFRPGTTIPDAQGKQVLPDRGTVESAIRARAAKQAEELTPEAEATITELSAKVPLAEQELATLETQLDEAETKAEEIGKADEELAKAAAAKVRTLSESVEAAESDLKTLTDELASSRRRVQDLARLPITTKVETIINRRKGVEALDLYDTDGDKAIDRAEWQAGKGSPEMFQAVDGDGDGDGDGRLTLAELNERLPERSYQVSTAVADVELLRHVVRACFGEALEASSGVKHELATSGKAPILGVALDPGKDGKTPVSAELTAKVPEEMQDTFVDMDGGVMLVIDKIAPPQPVSEIKARIRAMRAQPDFQDVQFNRTDVIALEAGPAGEGYSSVAVLVSRPVGTSYPSPEWDRFADRELELLGEAMAREATTESLAQFDAAIAARAAVRAGIAFVLSWAAIIVYLWVRFSSFRWGLAAVICLVHDVLIAVGMVALTAYIAASPIGKALLVDMPFKIDMAVVAAFLTVIGYSVNDTIVVFDRIRENRGRLLTVDEPAINRSINQTISRTLLTTFTTLIAVVTMYIAGGPGIRAFTFALLVGILVGTYSSVAVASPLLLGFKHALVGQVARAGKPARRT